jgi:uncharacterized protein YcbK (DUF882 family)
MLALCAALLSSCSSTGDPVARLGLTADPSIAPLAAASQSDEIAAAESGQPYFIVSEDDPILPEVASSVPSVQNRAEPAEQQVAAALPASTGSTAGAAAQQPSAERFAPGQIPPTAAPLAQMAAGSVAAVQNSSGVETGNSFAAPPAQKKRSGFFANLFASEPYQPRTTAQRPVAQPSTAARPQTQLASIAQPPRELASGAIVPAPTALQPSAATRASTAPGALPGVRESALFEIRRGNGLDDDSDIDVFEEDDGAVQVASAAGLARLAPNGLAVQTDRVDVACLKPSLVRVLKQIESRYGKKVLVTSGYRSPPRNRAARGAKNSLHMFCAAADIKVEGVTKFELAQYLRTMPGRGGVGTYCHTNAVHVDVGPERDWNWRCRRKKRR